MSVGQFLVSRARERSEADLGTDWSSLKEEMHASPLHKQLRLPVIHNMNKVKVQYAVPLFAALAGLIIISKEYAPSGLYPSSIHHYQHRRDYIARSSSWSVYRLNFFKLLCKFTFAFCGGRTDTLIELRLLRASIRSPKRWQDRTLFRLLNQATTY